MRPEPSSYPHSQHPWQHMFEPLDPPPAHGPPATYPTFSPIRDDSRVGPTEDLDRMPDGVPHDVVGLTAGFSVVLTILLASVWFLSSWTGRVGVVILLAVAIPVVVSGLRRKADRERDQIHPSR